MAGSYSSVYLQIVFSTQQRRPSLVPEQCEAVFAYMAGILREIGCQFVLVNGHLEHAHVVCTLPAKLALADLMAKLKGNSSRWIRESVEGLEDFRWQSGYAAFSFSHRQLEAVRNYVRHQQEHHRTKSFGDEYREFLALAAIEYDEQYLFG